MRLQKGDWPAHGTVPRNREEAGQELKPLTEEEQRFVALYIETFNGTKAALGIGIDPRKASGYASAVLRRPNVQAALIEWRAALAAKHGITLDKVIREISLIAFANMDDFTILLPDGKTRVIDFGKADRDKMAAVSEIVVDEEMDEDGECVAVRRVKLKLHPKLEALVKLLNHLGIEGNPLPGQNGETHYHVHMHGLEPPRPGEDRSYRDGYGETSKAIEHDPGPSA